MMIPRYSLIKPSRVRRLGIALGAVSGQRTVRIGAALAALVLSSCGDGAEPVAPPDPPRPTTVTVSPATAELAALGATVQLSAQVLDQNGQAMAGAGVTWSSSDAAVAAVDGSGLVTAAANGIVTITAAAGAASGTSTVTVAQLVSVVSVSPPADTLTALGDTVRLLAVATDANGHAVAGAEFAWASGDTLVARVDDSGLVEAAGNGAATISATAGSASGTSTVTVAQLVSAVAVSPPADTLTALGDTVRLVASATDANGHAVAGAEFAWASGDTLVARVDGSGLVEAVGNGAATISATAGAASGTSTVTVAQLVSAVAVSPPADTLTALGDTVRLIAAATDANGHAVVGAEFAWVSDNPLVARVDGSGLVEAVGNGAATVSATAGSASGISAVTVAQLVSVVAVSPAAATLTALGDTVRLVAAATDANGHAVVGAEFAWVSDNPRVARVEGSGLVEAVGNGTATVSATAGSASGISTVTVAQQLVRLLEPTVYLVQSVQTQARDVRLIAGREAMLRVWVTAREAVRHAPLKVVAKFSRGGRVVHTRTLTRPDTDVGTMADESDLSHSYNAVIPGAHIRAGTSLVVEVDPDRVVRLAPGSVTRFPASGAHSLDVVNVPPMELVVVPVLEATNPDSSIFSWTNAVSDNSANTSFLRQAFPFSKFSARTRSPYVTSLDLTAEGSGRLLSLELLAVRLADGNTTGHYYGAASSKNGYVKGWGFYAHWVSMGKAWDEELAHEVGHNMDLRHAPCGNPPDRDPRFPHRGGIVGAWGYDFDRRRLVDRMTPDVMGYCYSENNNWLKGSGDAWLSDYFYEKVIDYRGTTAGRSIQLVADAAGPRADVLVLSGWIAENGELGLRPVYSMRAAALLPEGTGTHTLAGTSADGRTIFSYGFTPWDDPHGGQYFFFTVPIQAGWDSALDRIAVTGPEGTAEMGIDDQRQVSLVTDRLTGEIRAILTDWEGELPAWIGDRGRLSVQTTRGLREAVRVRR